MSEYATEMKVTEFLIARIDEDEDEARKAIAERTELTPNEDDADMGFQCWPDSPVPAVLVGPERVLAECQAKRVIVGTYRAVAANRNAEGTVQWHEEKALLTSVRTLATVYADHPDYDAHWAL